MARVNRNPWITRILASNYACSRNEVLYCNAMSKVRTTQSHVARQLSLPFEEIYFIVENLSYTLNSVTAQATDDRMCRAATICVYFFVRRNVYFMQQRIFFYIIMHFAKCALCTSAPLAKKCNLILLKIEFMSQCSF